MSEPPARTALVLEDEPEVRRLLERLLSREGYQVALAGDVAEGLKMAREGRYHLLVLDKNLPDGSGEQVAVAARQLDPRAAIVILTAFASRDSAAALHGVVDLYLTKPFRMKDLAESFSMAIARREAMLAAGPAGPPRRVLLVEIEQRSRDACAAALAELGFEVVHGYSRGGMPELASQPQPDAMVLASEGCTAEVRSAILKVQTARPEFQVVLLTDSDRVEVVIDSVSLRAERVRRQSSPGELRAVFSRVFRGAAEP